MQVMSTWETRFNKITWGPKNIGKEIRICD